MYLARVVLSEGRRTAGRLLVKVKDVAQSGLEEDKRRHSLPSPSLLSDAWVNRFIPEGNVKNQEGEEAPPPPGKLAAAWDHGSGGARGRMAAQRRPADMLDKQTITDVCSGGELPEVEIISLLEEQIPRYRLRADTLTQFTGYENEDWFVPSPALKVDDADLTFTSEQIREVLNYFILCSNRVSQMTKTYNDIEAVTRLLEEKEKDLELTARIGKQLLADNQRLESSVAQLETELRSANEHVTQLSHEVHKKSELIQILTNDVDDSGSDASTPIGMRSINLDLLQRHVSSLQEENKSLRSEASQLANDTANCEQAEQRLMEELTSQLSTANQEMATISVELERVKEESRLQHEELVSLTSKLTDAEAKLQKTTVENDDITSNLNITRDNQNKLAMELADFKDRYGEVMNLLRDTQEQLRRQRRKGLPTARGGSLFPSLSTTANPDSIACELESSLYSELSLDSGIGGDRGGGGNYKKVFETVRCASRGSAHSTTSSSPIHQMHPRLGGTTTTMMQSTASSGPRMSAFASTPSASSGTSAPPLNLPVGLFPNPPPHHRMQPHYGSSLSFPSLDSVGQSDSESCMLTDSENESYPGVARTGVPGVPGAADLEDALRRLTPAEVLARRAMLSSGTFVGYEDGGTGGLSPPTYLPYGCRTPDSIMSTGSSGLSGFSGQSNGWKLPEKLQIVKPIEGSLTLAAWSQLATPTLGGLLDERPGVKTRGGRPLEDLGLHTYTLSDLEEDEEEVNPGKSFQSSGSVYTYTNSTVLHPDDNTTVTSSLQGSQMCPSVPMSHQISRQSTAPQTPVTRSRRNSTSTFSTTLGLAKLLNERGIKAVTPSCVATPCQPSSFTPTATPCNSPDGTPPPSPPPSPPPHTPSKLGFLSSGADLLRRTFSAESERIKPTQKIKRGKMALSRSERKALTGIRLVEKLERIGLETIMSTTASSISPLTLQGTLYSRRTLKSPMAQLTSLKNTIATTGVVTKLEPSSKDTKPIMSDTLWKPSSSESPRLGRPMPGDLGVPSRPGTGALDRLSSRRQPNGMVRPDLGTVLGNGPASRSGQADSCPSPALGSVNSMSLGRKGGLL